MKQETKQLCNFYKLNLNDMGAIHHLCARNMKEEAIQYIQKKTKDYDIAKQIVNEYAADHFDEIMEQAESNQRHKQEELRKIVQPDVPKCQYCGSTNLKKISGTSRFVSTGVFGLASKKIGKQFHCNNCGADF